VNRTWPQTLANLARAAFWLLLVVLVLLQLFGGTRGMERARADALQRFERERGTRVIALIHRQAEVDVLGVPVASYIDIEDSEAVLRAIRLTPAEQPIDLILHTPGGLVLAAEQIARALAERKAKVTVFVPHYAMSGGTLIALAADEIVMDANAVLGQVDPQIGELPAASIVRVVELKRPQGVSDEMLVLADMAQKARAQVAGFVAQLLAKRMPKDRAIKLAALLSEGRWTHDFPITADMARELGLPVSTNVPRAVYELMELYPQGDGVRPSVLYTPAPKRGEPPPPALPRGPRSEK
jgi:ClpP class serine protease